MARTLKLVINQGHYPTSMSSRKCHRPHMGDAVHIYSIVRHQRIEFACGAASGRSLEARSVITANPRAIIPAGEASPYADRGMIMEPFFYRGQPRTAHRVNAKGLVVLSLSLMVAR